MNLYLDFGNTRLKWTLVDSWNTQNMSRNLIYDVYHCPIGDLTVFEDFIHKYRNGIDLALLAMTKLSTKSVEVSSLLEKSNIASHLIRPSKRVLEVNYEDSSSFGIDRYLCMVAVKYRLKKKEDFCVVSAGTALTIDFVVSGKHIGGIIAPGVGTQATYLKKSTGLSLIKKPERLLGNSTETTIGAGIFHGQKFMVDGYIKQIESEYSTSIKPYYTGGNSDNLTNSSAEIYPALIFLGMTAFYEALSD